MEGTASIRESHTDYRKQLTTYGFYMANAGERDVSLAFDIETTAGQLGAYMWVWQFDLFDGKLHNTVTGRTWDEFKELLEHLINTNKKDRKRVIWIHNASYEWQFMAHVIEPCIERDKRGNYKIFALEERKIAKITLKNGIEFRCSYILSGTSLEEVGKRYTTTQKLKGDLDYSKPRNSKTPLSYDDGLAYCLNDVRVLTEYGLYILNKYDKLPLTKTSIVRNELKRRIKALGKQEQAQYMQIIERNFPSESIYKFLMEYVYCGGYNHANVNHVNGVIEGADMASFDFKSSYISSMFEPLPMGFIRSIEPVEDVERILKDTRNSGFMGDFIFYNIRQKTPHSIFSKHKIVMQSGGVFDNGRLRKANKLRIALTELDFESLLDFYDFDSFEVNVLFTTRKQLLPDVFLRYVSDLFIIKENTPKDTPLYMDNKSDLNSLYGMCVTSLYNERLVWNGNEFINEGLQDYNTARRSQFLLPQWGVWISATSRRNLLRLVKEFGNDNAYSDTDSSKLINYTKHLPTIEAYNSVIMERNRQLEAMGYHVGRLGEFSFEEKIERFATLGCKRYLAEYEGEIHCTIAGLPKMSLNKYAQAVGSTPFELFDFSLVVPAEYSGKLASKYIDEPTSELIIDEYGNAETMTSSSSVLLIPIPFTLSYELEYMQLIETTNRLNKFARRG